MFIINTLHLVRVLCPAYHQSQRCVTCLYSYPFSSVSQHTVFLSCKVHQNGQSCLTVKGLSSTSNQRCKSQIWESQSPTDSVQHWFRLVKSLGLVFPKQFPVIQVWKFRYDFAMQNAKSGIVFCITGSRSHRFSNQDHFQDSCHD